MSSGKRKPSTADAGAPLGKKPRGVKTTTCDKWVAEYDRKLSTSVWLNERSPSDRSAVENFNLRCVPVLLIKFAAARIFLTPSSLAQGT